MNILHISSDKPTWKSEGYEVGLLINMIVNIIIKVDDLLAKGFMSK